MSISEDVIAARAVGSQDYDTAIAIYKKKLAADAKDSFSLSMIAHCYEWKKDMETAIGYANKVLVEDPTDFSMLLLAARYWSGIEDIDRTYHYACRALDNPPEAIPEIPKWVLRIFRVFSIIPKFRNFDKKAKQDLARLNKEDKDNMEWAEEYKRWYEAKYGPGAKKSLH